MRRARFTAVCGVAFLAMAPMPAATATACMPDGAEEVRVADIVDGRTLALTDGRRFVLAALDPVHDPVVDRAASAALAPFRGAAIHIWPTRAGADRHGRHHGLAAGADGRTLQNRLIGAGLARFAARRPDSLPEGCFKYLISKENVAMQAQTGFWREAGQNAPFAIKNAESRDEMTAAAGRFVVAEGVVRSVRKSGATTYLNFARSYVRGFSAWVGRQRLAGVEAQGLNLAALEGRRVRLRGWIEMRQGPRMEIILREQVETAGMPAARNVR